MKICSACTWAFFVIGLIYHYDKSFDEQVPFWAFMVAAVDIINIMCLAIKCKRVLADYLVFVIMAARCTYTLVLTFYDIVDPKELSLWIPILAGPLLAIAICNVKLDLLVTVPMTIICTILVN